MDKTSIGASLAFPFDHERFRARLRDRQDPRLTEVHPMFNEDDEEKEEGEEEKRKKKERKK